MTSSQVVGQCFVGPDHTEHISVGFTTRTRTRTWLAKGGDTVILSDIGSLNPEWRLYEIGQANYPSSTVSGLAYELEVECLESGFGCFLSREA